MGDSLGALFSSTRVDLDVDILTSVVTSKDIPLKDATMLTVTALLFALNAVAPVSAAFYDYAYSPVEATSPAKARYRAARREAMPAPTQAPEYHPDLAMMPILRREPAGTDTCGFHTDDGAFLTLRDLEATTDRHQASRLLAVRRQRAPTLARTGTAV